MPAVCFLSPPPSLLEERRNTHGKVSSSLLFRSFFIHPIRKCRDAERPYRINAADPQSQDLATVPSFAPGGCHICEPMWWGDNASPIVPAFW